jgi:Asp-tRNA(Asn)/Glu-tRNA(Gln) amidotransferase C subunit
LNIDEEWVTRSAAIAGLQLTPAQLPGVVAYLGRTAQFAKLLNEFPLDPELDEPGPTWKP